MPSNQAPPLGLPVSVNRLAAPLVRELIDQAGKYQVAVSRHSTGVTLIDAGITAPGGLDAGVLIAKICMGGLGEVSIARGSNPAWAFELVVRSSQPVLACLASQYAGWSLNHGSGKEGFSALGSGPARAIAAKEPLFSELGYRDEPQACVLVLEVDKPPPDEILAKVCRDCEIEPAQLTLILTPTTSLAGITQVVARVLEVALHKAHALHFPLTAIVDGMASAPVAPPAKNFMVSMGRSNDAILFGGEVHLMVRCDDDQARALAKALPSSASRDYGVPFAEVFKAANYDFYKIDLMLFAPAQVLVSNLKTGQSFAAGFINQAQLARSFGGPEALVAGT